MSQFTNCSVIFVSVAAILRSRLLKMAAEGKNHISL